jgi:Protein of unknown function (DUF2723)
LALTLFLLFLAVYVRTAAPSVLSGDSAEFQLAAPLLGVPHPTTYPLYVLLGKLATLLVPFGDMAWRVTLVSALSAALAVALFYMLARRVAGLPGAAVAALALGVAPGLWNAATLAEVYALLAALLAGLGYLLAPTAAEPRADNQATQSKIQNLKSKIGSPVHPSIRSEVWRLRGAAFVTGLGCTHHGLFVLTGLPLFVGYVLWWLARQPTTDDRTNDNRRRTTDDGQQAHQALRFTFYVLRLKQFPILVLCFAAGLAPWLFPLAQFARYGPFDGQDYGLPRHYFWGAPGSWGAALDLLTGGALRRGIFRLPQADAAWSTLRLVGARMSFEFGPLGVVLGVLGCVALARRSRAASLGAAWVFLVTLIYLLLLGPAVADAPIFTLPMLLPWALWVAAAVQLILDIFRQPTTDDRRPTEKKPTAANHPEGTRSGTRTKLALERSEGNNIAQHATRNTQQALRFSIPTILLVALVAATLAWGYTRMQYASKRRLWLFREFGQATLAGLPPGAVLITHWEQGMTLQYLRLVEGQRPDVWVDVVEPTDEGWGARAARRYAGRPVFFVGQPADVAGLPVELAHEAEYADLFQLREGR